MFLNFFRKKSARHESDEEQGLGRMHGIDVEMFYCSACDGEFRLELPSCPSCGKGLISGVEKLAHRPYEHQVHASRSMYIEPGTKLVSIRKGALREIKYLLKVLENGYIPALISGDESGCGKGCCGPEMYLQIRETDVEPALELLAKDFIRSTALDEHDLCNASAVFDPTSSETKCPACGCKFSPSVGACPECGLCFE